MHYRYSSERRGRRTATARHHPRTWLAVAGAVGVSLLLAACVPAGGSSVPTQANTPETTTGTLGGIQSVAQSTAVGSGVTPRPGCRIEIREAWVARTERIPRQISQQSLFLGELLVCEQANQQFVREAEQVCNNRFGILDNYRNVSTDTDLTQRGFNCNCREGRRWTDCDLRSNAVCTFEEQMMAPIEVCE